MENSQRRYKNKKRKKRRKIFFRSILILGISIFILGKIPYFEIEEISIIGNNNIENEKIIKTSQIEIGDNIFRTNMLGAKKNIRTIPYIKEVKLRPSIPNKINIHVVEHEEAFLIRDFSNYYLVNIDGLLLNKEARVREGTPIIQGVNTDNYQLGNNVYLEDGFILEEFISYSQEIGFLDKIRIIDAEYREEINIILNNGIDIAFGPLNDVKYKLSYILEIMEDLEAKDVKYSKIIMNRGNNPIVVVDE